MFITKQTIWQKIKLRLFNPDCRSYLGGNILYSWIQIAKCYLVCSADLLSDRWLTVWQWQQCLYIILHRNTLQVEPETQLNYPELQGLNFLYSKFNIKYWTLVSTKVQTVQVNQVRKKKKKWTPTHKHTHQAKKIREKRIYTLHSSNPEGWVK